MIISIPIKKLVIKTDTIASEKYAMSIVPIIAPVEIAKKVVHGLIPISLPIIDPTKPPDPWNGTITKRTIPIKRSGLIQEYLSDELLPIFSTFIMNFPINGIFFARS